MTKPLTGSDSGLIPPETEGRGPERMCALTRAHLPPADMVRFVRSPEGLVVPDISARLPGRGVWLTARREIVDAAVRQAAFSRAFKDKSVAPDGLADLVERLLVRRCIELLGLARKAGAAVAGFDQVRDALKSTCPALLLEARDGALDGRRKVLTLAHALYQHVPVAGALDGAELGQAFGRAGVVHVFVRKGGLADSWQEAYRRLTGFRTAPESGWFPDPEY